jgi:hypothetical protein
MTKELGKHAYAGNCAPGNRDYPPDVSQETFSFGIFQWVKPEGSKTLRKSAVIVRVKGYVSQAEKVRELTEALIEKLDNGWLPDKKSYSVF